MTVRNPFLSIVPRQGEEMIGISQNKVRELADLISGGKAVLLVSGDYGSGKSLVTEKIENALTPKVKIEKWMFSVDMANQIRSLPIEETFAAERARKKVFVVFVDRFELSDVMDDKELAKVLRLIVEVSRSGVSFVISTTPKTVIRLYELSNNFKNISTIYRINPMTYPEAVELVISRLNEVRLKKSNKLEPFTDQELKDIWKKSHGNPRMILLILANLFSIKMQQG
jgi:hypothetical protein